MLTIGNKTFNSRLLLEQENTHHLMYKKKRCVYQSRKF